MKTRLIVLLYFIVASSTNAQTLFEIIRPNLFSTAQESMALDSQSFRYFSTSQNSHAYFYDDIFVTDWDVNTDSFLVWTPLDSSGMYPLLYSPYEIKLLRFASGDCILVTNNFDCDFGPMSQAAYIEKDGSVRWHEGLDYWDPFLWEINNIGIVGSEVVAFLSDEDTLYFTFHGEELEYTSTPTIYLDPYIDNESIYGYLDNRWVQLSSVTFEELDEIFVDTVYLFQKLNQNNFLFNAENGITLLNGDLEELQDNHDIGIVYSAAQVLNYIYLVTDRGLEVLDLQLNLLKIYTPEPSEKMKFVFQKGDSAMVISNYEGISHTEQIARLYHFSDQQLIPYLNLELNMVELPDTVLFNYTSPNHHYAVFHFDTITFLVTNHSLVSVHSFDVKFDWYGGFQCSYYQGSWQMRDVAIGPGQSFEFSIYNYSTDSTYTFPWPYYCFWVELPNGDPDQFPEDDKACGSSKLSVSTANIGANTNLNIYPNPAFDVIYFNVDQNATRELNCSVYNSSGILTDQFKVGDNSDSHSIKHYAPGLYIILIYNNHGVIDRQRILKL